ncbi:MAG: glycosyltransferase family 39 protein [Bacteroidetes bacterium]|nr:glycosyltransferase family 39 protein [Bacteroidota bacterium]
MHEQKKIRKYLILLIAISTLIRAFIAATIELGNDEVYYRLYALFPDWSHFDHPLMVGLTIQFFSFDLLFDSEFFLRLGSIIFGAVNTWIIYQIGRAIKNERTGFYAALLYTASLYAFIITGVFILPDTPQNFFWLLSILFMIKAIPMCPNLPMSGLRMLRMGLVIGLAILSKYTSVFLWVGVLLYIIIYNRDWLKNKWLYYSIALTAIISLPVLIWNLQYDFISFTFHGERVEMSGYNINLDYFLTELLGEFLYNNPVNFILILLTLVVIARKNLQLTRAYTRTILMVSLPLIITFLVFSLFRKTLPHWSAPAYTTLLVLVAAWIDQLKNKKTLRIPGVIFASFSVLFIIIALGYSQIKFGIIDFKHLHEKHGIKTDDPSLDMFGFDQVGEAFEQIVIQDQASGLMSQESILVGNFWFPLANFDYYASSPIGMKSYGIGRLDQIHKYAWINRENGGFKKGMDAYYLTTTRDYRSPYGNINSYFEEILPADTILIKRNSRVVKKAFVYRLKNLQQIPDDVLMFD